MFRAILKAHLIGFASISVLFVSGCNVPINNNQPIKTTIARVTASGTVHAPLGSQHISGTWQSDIFNYAVSPRGNSSPFDSYTDADGNYTYSGMRMPSNWQFTWYPTNTCYDVDGGSYNILPSVQSKSQSLYPGVGSYEYHFPFSYTLVEAPQPQAVQLVCYTNTPSNPDFGVGEVNPSFVLDNQFPSEVQVSSLRALPAAPSQTALKFYSTSLNLTASTRANSIAADRLSASFSYPSIPAGAYIGTIVSNPDSPQPTTDGIEPFFVGHNDTSYEGAFGVAVAQNGVYTVTTVGADDIYNDGTCAGQTTTSTWSSGSAGTVPVVTLLTQNKIAVGNNASTINVGNNPTSVVPFHSTTYAQSTQLDQCHTQLEEWSGTQSALVVNTGDNTVSVVSLSGNPYLSTGTIPVGNQPVAAVVSNDENTAYVANYTDGTVTQISLQGMNVIRSFYVMPHPTSLSLDNAGNLWVGGQGAISRVDTSSGQVNSTYPVDGTVNSLAIDSSKNTIIHTLLQNGSVFARSSGSTHANAINYSNGASYSISGLLSLSTESSTTYSVPTDNAVFLNSPISSRLAFPAQTSFKPPIVSANNEDLTATAEGNTFTISTVGGKKIVLQGTVPYPIRSIAIGGGMLYFTMPETNSLVSLPVVLP